VPLPDYWSTNTNGAAFGTDYFTRTAAAKSNILVNKPNEAKCFDQDLDASGARQKYTVTFGHDRELDAPLSRRGPTTRCVGFHGVT
jgi:hypothetical protein